jgi:two-component system, sensor histidine kinase
MKSLNTWWNNLSVAKKLYAVVGVMALLIATELLALRFAMSTLSSVRAFVGGEGLWSKAQKSSVLELQKYALTHDPVYYQQYLHQLKIPLGDRRARLELEKPTYDYETVKRGFLDGEIHPNDIEGMVKLLTRFHQISYLSEAVQAWRDADQMIVSLQDEAQGLDRSIRTTPNDRERIDHHLQRIYQIDKEVTLAEAKFSYVLGEGSRWLEGVLMTILLMAVLAIESTGLLLTISFSRNLSRGLNELNDVAQKVGTGIFDINVPVRSKDELGQLAESLNKMISDLKQNIGEKRRAQSASQSKNMFLANMSHEIRTPLGSILGFTDLLRDPDLTQEQRQNYLDVIERTGMGLTKIINDILDISKMEAGHLEIQDVDFSLSQLLSDIRSIFQFRIQEKAIQLKLIGVGLPPDNIRTDPVRLRQILMNLLGNAVKFTDRGNITLEYGLNEKQIYFNVSDSGPGIPQNRVHELFQPFTQLDSTPSRRHEGTGLGLVLSKRLAQAMGGDVILTTNSRFGTTFTATIAFESAKSSETNQIQAPGLGKGIKGKNILLVDDVPENQLLVRLKLEKAGAKMSVANNGAEGVRKAGEQAFDLILMDMQMPVMDGYEATKTLRKSGYDRPIIALTAHAMTEDRKRCLEAGCDEYLTKPVNFNELIATIERQDGQTRNAIGKSRKL